MSFIHRKYKYKLKNSNIVNNFKVIKDKTEGGYIVATYKTDQDNMALQVSSYRFLQTNYDCTIIYVCDNNIEGSDKEKEDILDSCDGDRYIKYNNFDKNFYIKMKKSGESKVIFQFKNKISDLSSLFERNTYLVDVDFSYFNSSLITRMGMMFTNCPLLSKVDLSTFNISNTISMNAIFYYCTSLTSVKMPKNLNTTLTKMNLMFYNCVQLKKIDLSDIDGSNIKNISNIFCDCHSLKEFILPDIKNANINDMINCFEDCHSITCLDLTKINCSNCVDMSNMCNRCKNLKCIKIKGGVDKLQRISNVFTDINPEGEFICDCDHSYNVLINELPTKWKVTKI